MRATLTDGTPVSIGWQYNTCQKELKHVTGSKVVDQNCVTCFIRVVPPKGEEVERKHVLSEVTITRYHTDPDNKPLARKTTFGLACRSFSKEDKAILWEVFLRNVKLPGHVKSKK